MKKYTKTLLSAFVGSLAFFHTASAQDNTWVSHATAEVKLDTALAFAQYAVDINNDKYPDLVTIEDWDAAAVNKLHVYMNVQDTASQDPKKRIFVDITARSGVNVKPGGGDTRGTLVVALADINNDGNVDLVRGNYYHRLEAFTDQGDRCEVLLGDGQGEFTLVPNNGLHEIGLINTGGFSFLDYDKDGKIDLFIAVYFKDYTKDIWEAGYLMKGNGDGTFTNVSAAAGITTKEPMYGCSAIDWNNDGWPDIATAPYCRTRGQLLKNKGDGTFEDVAVAANYNLKEMQGDNGQNLCMWSNVPEDFDNDGDMDFFFSLVHGGLGANEGRSTMVMNGGAANNYSLSWAMNKMTRKGSLQWPVSSHLGDYDASWLDLDNDGLEDLVMAQGTYSPNTDRLYIFHQKPDTTFVDITSNLGLLSLGTQLKDLHLVEAIDYDLDGDDDIVYCRAGRPRQIHIIKNNIGHTKNWTGIRLIAPHGVNKSSIGARVYVWSGGVSRMREVYAGRGNSSGQQPFAMLFGLGGNTKIDSVKVVWPGFDNPSAKIINPPINQYLTLGRNGLGIASSEADQVQPLLKVYPNPAAEFILVQLSNNKTPDQVEIYDMIGKKMNNVTIFQHNGATKYCAIGNLVPGHYIVKVSDKNGKVYTQQFVKAN